MKLIAATDRLYLREFIMDDSVHFYQMNADKQVLQYTGDIPFISRKEALDFLHDYKEYDLHGIGRWAVIRKSDEEFLGWCGLKYHPEENITEVGFRFYRKYWGMGYATEAARAAVEYGFSNRKILRIYAHAHIDNKASLRVIDKLGMEYQGEITYGELPAKLFKLDNPYYRREMISAAEVLKVRHPILRKGRPLEDAIFEGDTKADTFHLGMYCKDSLVGVVTLMKKDQPGRPGGRAYQLRGMAVMEDYRGMGVGKQLVTAAEKEVLNRGCSLIWMNAREKAVNFYLEQGYQTRGELFEITGVGPHYYMEKPIIH